MKSFSIFPVDASMRRTCASRVVARYVWPSCEGTTEVTGSSSKKHYGMLRTGICGARTTDEVAPELAHAEVVRADVAVHGAGEDVCGPDVQCLYCIARFVEDLDGLTVL